MDAGRRGSAQRRRLRSALLPARRHEHPDRQRRKQEIVAQFGDERPGHRATPASRSPCSPQRINDLTEHLREHKKDHHSRRGLLMLVGRAAAAQLPAEAATSRATARSSSELGLRRVSDHRARDAGRRLHAASARTASAFTQDDLRGQDDRPRLLPVRVQPGLHRPVPGLRGGARRARGAGRDALRRLDATQTDRRRPSASSSASRSSSSRTSSPRARPSRAFGAYFEPAGMTNRALVIVGPDGVVHVVATSPTHPGDLPGRRTSSSTALAPQRRRAVAARRRRSSADRSRAVVEDRLDVAVHEQPAGQLAERAEADRVADGVAHQRAAVADGLERVRVVPAARRARGPGRRRSGAAGPTSWIERQPAHAGRRAGAGGTGCSVPTPHRDRRAA